MLVGALRDELLGSLGSDSQQARICSINFLSWQECHVLRVLACIEDPPRCGCPICPRVNFPLPWSPGKNGDSVCLDSM